MQVAGTGNGNNNAVRVFSGSEGSGDPFVVTIRGGESSCYGTKLLPVEALGTEYYAICAGYTTSPLTPDVSQVRARRTGKPLVLDNLV